LIISSQRHAVYSFYAQKIVDVFVHLSYNICMESNGVIIELPDYEGMRKQLTESLKQLLLDRAKLDQQIIALQGILKGFDVLCDPSIDFTISSDSRLPSNQPGYASESELVGLGLTDAIRIVFQRTFEPLSPMQVRDRLKLANYDVPGDNPAAAVHGVIRRLYEGGEIKQAVHSDGKVSYRWISAFETALKGLDEAGALAKLKGWNVPSLNFAPAPTETTKRKSKPRIFTRRRRRLPKPPTNPTSESK
jgi:hypothetical protein